MGRLTLNVLLSFAQFEREVIGERVRDKIVASKRKGIWVGGPVPLGYRWSVNQRFDCLHTPEKKAGDAYLPELVGDIYCGCGSQKTATLVTIEL
jgi:DNA invertase Pin-like site-specific DNA recombinase